MPWLKFSYFTLMSQAARSFCLLSYIELYYVQVSSQMQRGSMSCTGSRVDGQTDPAASQKSHPADWSREVQLDRLSLAAHSTLWAVEQQLDRGHSLHILLPLIMNYTNHQKNTNHRSPVTNDQSSININQQPSITHPTIKQQTCFRTLKFHISMAFFGFFGGMLGPWLIRKVQLAVAK